MQPAMELDSTTLKPSAGNLVVISDVIVPPPTFSRLPPDGHEFPPNFSEPIQLVDINSQTGKQSDKM